MSDAVVIAIIGGGCGIATTLITGIPKLYELWKEHKGDTLESRIERAMNEAMKQCSNATNKKIDALRGDIGSIQKDVTRLRLIYLIHNEPTDAENILSIGRLYFGDLRGNSEAKNIFERWLLEQGIKRPLWLKEDDNGKE